MTVEDGAIRPARRGERLRIINGGVESSRLRVGKRIADVLILFMLATAAFWLIMALVGLSTNGPS